jgi:hypothetical protein
MEQSEKSKATVSVGNCRVGKITSRIFSVDTRKSVTIEFTKDSFADYDTLFLEKKTLANWLR